MMTEQKILKAGVIGWPVSQSLSPRLHGYWLEKYGIRGSYQAVPVEPQHLGSFLKNLPESGLRGVNVTVPHKESVAKLVDILDPLAARIGAVNTVVVHENGTLEGRNTDMFGFAENLRSAGFKGDKKPAIILGAGGAARAVLAALTKLDISEAWILNRTRERAEILAKDFPEIPTKIFDWHDPEALKDAGLLVNATSLGMKGQPPLEINLGSLPREAWVTDIVYSPLQTELLKDAATRGHRTVDGLGMLLHQACPAFQAFFGILPDITPELRAFILGDS